MTPDRWLVAPAKALAFVCGTALVLTSLLVTIDVASRRLLNWSLTGADEVSGYVLAVTAAWGFGYAALVKAHIRIDTAIRLIGQPARAALDVVAHAALLVFAVALAYHAYGVLAFSAGHASRSQTPLQIPLWIPQALWAAGLFFFAVVCLAMVSAAVIRMVRRDWIGASEILNADEIAEEVAGVRPGERQEPAS